jgi:CRISPR-associated endonuclease Cas1
MTLSMNASSARVETGRPVKQGILVLRGYGVKLFVQRGHLVFEDGIGRTRRSGRLARVGHGLKRLIIIGHSGLVSLEALRWLHDVGAAFVQIDADGQLITCAGPDGLDDARLRRAQALASDFGTGIGIRTGTVSGSGPGVGFGIARDLIKRKLLGQLQNLNKLRDKAAVEKVNSAIERIPTAENIDALRFIEGEAAIAYWGAWRDIDVVFVERDRNRVPEHWLTFGVRRSLLSKNPRNATNPANAILNYLYSILESEARIAAITMGLDPGMGVMHADQRGRDSLACDLMEAARPRVDDYVLELLRKRAFKKSDFFETREGACRVTPQLAKQLVETGTVWAKQLAPTTELVAKRLVHESNVVSRRLSTPLTENNRSIGRSNYRERLMRIKESISNF